MQLFDECRGTLRASHAHIAHIAHIFLPYHFSRSGVTDRCRRPDPVQAHQRLCPRNDRRARPQQALGQGRQIQGAERVPDDGKQQHRHHLGQGHRVLGRQHRPVRPARRARAPDPRSDLAGHPEGTAFKDRHQDPPRAVPVVGGRRDARRVFEAAARPDPIAVVQLSLEGSGAQEAVRLFFIVRACVLASSS